jgi:hypothetical protein
MQLHAVLSAIALVFVAIGGLVQVYSLRVIWRNYGPEPLLAPVTNTLRARIRRAGQQGRRFWMWVRGEHPIHVAVGAGSMEVGTGFGRARVQFGSLPSGSKDALAELDGRTKELMTLLAAEKEQREDDVALIRKDADALGTRLDAEVERVTEQVRRVAYGGVRRAALSLSCSLVALVFQIAALIAS